MKMFAAVIAVVMGIASTAAQAQIGKADGEIRKVNKEAGELTIKHGPFEGIDMGGMTMIFPVKDKAILDNVKAGDRVNFTVSLEGKQVYVTGIEVKRRN